MLLPMLASVAAVEINGIWYNLVPKAKEAEVTRNPNGSGGYSASIEIPASVTYNEVKYSVTSIGSSAFYYCSGLISVTIGNSVTSIGGSAFYGTAWYNNQPDGLVYAGKVAYKYKGKMPGNTTISLKDGTVGIAENAFYYCRGLTSITIPNSVTSIGDGAFGGCSGLTSVTIPNSVTYIGKEAFDGCDNLESSPIPERFSKRIIHVEKAGSLSSLIPGDILLIENLTLTGEINGSDLAVIREMGGKKGKLSVLDLSGVKIVKGGVYLSVNYDGYSSASLVQDDVIPAGVFEGCKYLTSISIPSSLKNVGAYAFDGTAWYENQPDGLVYIGNILYKYKGEMSENTHIDIKEGTIGIANTAFYGQSSLSSITIPNSVKHIGYYDIENDDTHSFINLTGGRAGWGYSCVFSGCTGLTSIDIPNGVSSIGSAAFSGCTSLTSVTIGNSVTSIGSSAFRGCSSLTSVTIPNSVTSIGEYSFSGCSGLTSITIPSGVTYIDWSAFSGCSGLTSINVESDNEKYDSRNNCNAIIETSSNTLITGCKNTTIPNSVTSIGNRTFFGCSSLTSVTIPSSVTSIGVLAFYLCTGLTSVTIPNSVTSIGDGAFWGCSGLTSVTIPNSVTSIGVDVFRDCIGLKKVVSKIKVPFEMYNSTFSSIPSDAELIVPLGTKSLYEATEGWNKFSKITEYSPTLETQPAQPTSTTKARLIALTDEEDDDQHFGFEWVRYNAPDDMPPYKVSVPLYDGRIVGSLGGLNPDVYYKYRPFYQSDSGEMVYGEWIPFNTGDANVFFEPETHTKEATDVTPVSAQLAGVWVEGTEDIAERGFEYWIVSGALTRAVGNDVKTVVVSGDKSVVTIEGLAPGKEYGYHSFAKTTSGTVYGEERAFKTRPVGDVNRDGKLDDQDVKAIADHVMGKTQQGFNIEAADANQDKKVDAADIVTFIKYIKEME